MLKHVGVEEIKWYHVNYTYTYNKRNYMMPNELYVIIPAQREMFNHMTFFEKSVFHMVYFDNKIKRYLN